MLHAQKKYGRLVKKAWQRIRLMGLSSVYKGLSQFFSLLLSYLVIRWYSDALWGSYVQYLLVVQLASQVLAWGSGDYVLREFSKTPHRIPHIWQMACSSRSILLIPVLASIYLTSLSATGKLLLGAWVFIDFVYGLFGVVIIYLRKYKVGTIVELSGHIFLITALYLNPQLSEYQFIELFIYALLLKASLQFIFFRKIVFQAWKFTIDWQFLKQSFPFLIVGLIALLQTKVDMYLVAFFLEEALLGQYQVMMRWMSLGHLGLTFVLMPYIQSFYRLPTSSGKRLILKISILGLVASGLQLIALFAVFTQIYQFQLAAILYFWMFLHMLPFYAYYLKIYECFKKDQQHHLTICYFVTGCINALLSYYFIPKMGILGALITSTIIQYLLLIFFFIIEPRYEKHATH